MQTNRKLITVFVLAILAFMVSGSAASANAATIQKIPTCMDPTGHNLPCMMIISTLPAPPNALQCQETSGQILACSYATQYLSNGEQIVVITVYVPANFVFSGGGAVNVVRVVVHETTTKIIRGGPGPYTLSVTIKVGTDPIVHGHIETMTVTVSDKSNPSMKIVGAKVSGELFYASGSHKPISCTTSNQNGESHCSSIIGPNSTPGTFKITVQVSSSGYKPASKSATFMVIPKTNTTSVANATIPINMTTSHIGTNGTGNYSASSSAVGSTGPGGGSNGTQAIQGNQLLPQLQPPTVDCNANPSDTSCSQQPPPKTQTCPDGSQPDSSGKCPTAQLPPPSQPSNPPNTSNPPSGSSSDKGNDNSGAGGGTSDSGGGSSPPSPSTLP